MFEISIKAPNEMVLTCLVSEEVADRIIDILVPRTFPMENKSRRQAEFYRQEAGLPTSDDFCGFCQGPCKGSHYISQSSEGY